MGLRLVDCISFTRLSLYARLNFPFAILSMKILEKAVFFLQVGRAEDGVAW